MLNRFFITCMLIVLSSTMTKGQQKLYYWFDTPTTLRGQKVWYEGHRERCADGRQDERTNRCKPVAAGDAAVNPDPEWESQSIPLGNGSIGANVMGSVAAERITLNEKTLWRGVSTEETGQQAGRWAGS